MARPKNNFVGKEEFEESMGKLMEVITELKEKPADKPVEKPENEVERMENTDREEGYLPPKFNELIDQKLGKEFGRTIVYPDNGPRHIHILVPKELSNSSQAHWIAYKSDVRSIVLQNNEGIDTLGVKLDKIANNLKIKKNNLV